MSCPKCLGFIVPDGQYDDQQRCINCGLRMFNGHALNLPPFYTEAERERTHRVAAQILRPLTEDERTVYNAYMKQYMRKYRSKSYGTQTRQNPMAVRIG